MFISTCLLIENNFPKYDQANIAKSILLAQDLIEESWNGKKYLLTNKEAANKVCETNNLPKYFKEIILSFITFFWNDSQYWAETILKTNNEIERYS